MKTLRGGAETSIDRQMKKGLGTSLYTLSGVLIVAIFTLFLFLTQSQNAADNLRTIGTADKSFDTEIRLQRLYTTSFPVPREDNINIITALSYGCEYGNPAQSHAFEISGSEGTYIETENFLESYLNKTLRSNYRFKTDCGNGEKIIVGENVPSNPEKVVSSVLEIPLASGNKTEVILKRW